MARNATETELTVLGLKGRRVRPQRLEIQNIDGSWKELTNLSGEGFSGLNFLRSMTWTRNRDNPTWTGTVSLMPEIKVGGIDVSIMPDVESSPANVDNLGAYAPLIDGMRRIRFFTTTARLDGTDGSERKVFDGYVVDFDEEGGMTMQVADLGHLLVITQIRNEKVYGSTAGVLLQTVIQEMLDDALGVGVIPLVVDASITAEPIYVREFNPGRPKLMEGVRSVAIETVGAAVQYMWKPDEDEMEFRLFLPPRNKVVSDFTFSADNYEPKPMWGRRTDEIRNDGVLYYQAEDNKSVVWVARKVQESIDRYKARYFEFKEIATKHVTTQPEAQRMLDTALSDLAYPRAQKRFTTQYAWAFEPWDRFTMLANGKQYTTDQVQWVDSVTHTVGAEAKQTRTKFETSGRVVGFSSNWLSREGLGPRPSDTNPLSSVNSLIGEGSMYGGELFNDKIEGCLWLFVFAGPNIRRFHVWHRETAPGATVPLYPPTGSDMYKAATIERPEGKIPREGNYTFGPGPFENRRVWKFLIPLPTTPKSTGGVVLIGEDENGKMLPEQRFTAVATDVGVGDPGAFAAISITRPEANTIEVTYIPETPTGSTLFFRNGVNIDQIDDDGEEQTWLDEEIHADKEYVIQAVRIANGATGARTTVIIAPHAPSLVFAGGTPEYDDSLGYPAVRIDASGFPGGTTHVGIQKSVDSGQTDGWTEANRFALADLPWHDVVVLANQYYRLVAYDVSGNVLDTSLPAHWTRPAV